MEIKIGTWARATRPRFLTITLVAVCLGLAVAVFDGHTLHGVTAVLSCLGAVCAHAGANMVNDFHDREADAGNVERLSPFTGGSRLIQDGQLSARSVAFLGYLLLAAALVIGIVLVSQGKTLLSWLGLGGLSLAVAYSAPPLRLSGRGWGELTVAAAWLLVVVGVDLVQRDAWSLRPVIVGIPLACLVAAILWVNEFPDYAADLRAGKRTMVVIWGRVRAARAHLLLVIAAYGWLVLALWFDLLPATAWLGSISLPWSLFAAVRLLRVAEAVDDSARFLPVVKATILAAHLHGIALVVALLHAATPT